MTNKNIKLFPFVVGLFVVGTFSMIIGVALDAKWWSERSNRDQITRDIPVSDFDKVVADDYADVEIIQGDKELLIVTGSKSFIDDSSANVSNGTLTIRQHRTFRFQFFSFGRDERISYKLYVKNLSKIENNGVGSFSIRSLKTNTLSLVNKGVGSVVFENLEAQKVSVQLDGTGSIELSGKTGLLEAHIDGVGSLEAFPLVSESCDITLRGVGSAEVNCSQTLLGKVSGIGDISYRGRPQVTKEVSGLGSISAD